MYKAKLATTDNQKLHLYMYSIRELSQYNVKIIKSNNHPKLIINLYPSHLFAIHICMLNIVVQSTSWLRTFVLLWLHILHA